MMNSDVLVIKFESYNFIKILYPLNLIIEIKGYRGEDAKDKKLTMDTYWIPGINNLGSYGRWAFAEFTEVYQIKSDFEAKVNEEFNRLVDTITVKAV